MSDDKGVCPRGHKHSHVVRDGIQRRGGREKQRWRCVLPDGSFHRFLGTMSRTRTEDGTCLECENHIHPHQGPQAPAEFEYLVREIAGALVDIGRGQTYTDAAKRVRARANIGKTAARRDVINGQTVAEWTADFVSVVARRHTPTEWPAVLVLDATSFRWTDPRTTNSMNLYTVLAAYGYDKDGRNGRLWKLEATPASGADAWAEFLASLPGKPDSIVCDQDQSITMGVEKRWGQWAAVNLIHHCEHHLSERAKLAFKSDKLDRAHPVREAFHDALKSREQWDKFEDEVAGQPRLVHTNKWLVRNQTMLRGQIQGRASIPPVYSNGAVEQPLQVLRKDLLPRAFVFRNRVRLNNLLTLMRLANLRVDNVADYAADIREHLDALPGRPKRTYREVYDPKADTAGTIQFGSLWAIPTQIAMRDARTKRTIDVSAPA